LFETPTDKLSSYDVDYTRKNVLTHASMDASSSIMLLTLSVYGGMTGFKESAWTSQ
jgi:hypothetical protein